MPRHSTKPRQFQCPYCDKAYVQNCHLNIHIKLKHSENPVQSESEEKETIQCPEGCGMSFTSENELKKHLNTRHDPSLPVKCAICTCRFSKKRTMRQHCAVIHKSLLDQDPERKDQIFSEVCDKCGMTFTSQSKLQRHKWSKHEDRKHHCEECNVSFLFPKDLRAHIKKVHLKQRSCPICDKIFQGSYKLYSEHKKECAQINGPQHVCPYPDCFAAFSKKYNLQVHLKSVHNERDTDFQCNLCQKKFPYKKIVQRHIQNIHRVSNVNLDSLYKEVPFEGASKRDDISKQIENEELEFEEFDNFEIPILEDSALLETLQEKSPIHFGQNQCTSIPSTQLESESPQSNEIYSNSTTHSSHLSSNAIFEDINSNHEIIYDDNNKPVHNSSIESKNSQSPIVSSSTRKRPTEAQSTNPNKRACINRLEEDTYEKIQSISPTNIPEDDSGGYVNTEKKKRGKYIGATISRIFG